MNLMQIDYFVELAKRLNFTEASKNLYISQPALSKQIAILEKELGTPLFERNHRLIRLTEAGTILLQECNTIRQQISDMIMKVQQIGCNQTGDIHVGCLKGINSDEFFINTIKKFSGKYPNCNIQIYKYEFNELREKLEEGVLDIIFTLSFELKLLTNVLSKLIQYRSGYFVISKDHPLAQKEQIHFTDLEKVPFIIINESNSEAAAETNKKKWDQYNYVPYKIIRVPNVDTMLSYIELGLGVSILDISILKKSTNIKCYEVPNGKDSHGVVSIWKKDNRNPLLSLLLSEIEDIT